MSKRDVAGVEIFALITGGGTGGHVYPAVALAEALVGRGYSRDSIRFVGARRGLEADAVPKAGFAIDLLPGRGLQRRLTLANFVTAYETARAFVQAWRLVRRYHPRVVVGVGGYASLPCVVMARLRRIPVVVHEQNAAPGLSNRIAVRLGACAAVSLPGTPLAGAVFTGNPVRAVIAAAADTATSTSKTGSPRSVPMLLIFGGSLGARRLNDAAIDLYDHWRHRSDVSVHHVCGRRDYQTCMERLGELRRSEDALDYQLVDYEDHMDLRYRDASLAACRAGAVTIAELAATGTPAILVPLPGAPDDHQMCNARALADVGAAVIVPDAELTGERLAGDAEDLLTDEPRRRAMSKAARGMANPDAANRLADVVEGAAR